MFRCFLLFFLISTLATVLGQNQAFSATSGVDFQLKGVLISPTSRSALVNGKIAREGERVAGVEILAIEEGAVRVLTGSQEYTVLVGSGAWLEPSAVRSARSVRQSDSPVRRVNSGDTLSTIAEDYAGNGVSLNQAMVALFEANPHAFDGNINRLRAGAELHIPDTREIRHHAPDAAMAEVVRQTETWRAADRAETVRIARAPSVNEFVPVSLVTLPGQSEYGPVRFGETLSEIAVEVSGDGVSMNQMMVALFEANPQAFSGNINILHEGAVLRIPAVNEVLRQTPDMATAKVLRHTEMWRNGYWQKPESERTVTLMTAWNQ